MTVKELRDLLATLPDDTLVVMAKDAEGNGFSPCEAAQSAYYRAETTWSGNIEAAKRGRGYKPCVVLWPVN